MYKVQVQYGQNIWDMAMQEYGNADGVMYILQDNDLESINDELEPGQIILIDESKQTD